MKGKIFNAQEVQAIIAGNKRMFREVIKPQPKFQSQYVINAIRLIDKCPYQVGQKIFVKESFLQKINSTQLPSGEHESFFYGSEAEYVADGAQERWDNPDVCYPNWWKKRPAQYMKQEHSRITLLIKEIRVERLQDISGEDAKKEGFSGLLFICDTVGEYKVPARTYFQRKWDATRKKPEEKFEASPFVWVISFEVMK
jgi:hypothetical protein